jgi:predicted dehydrogenase
VLKVAIVGCGKIADAHASQIQRIKGCEIVAVCDREPLMARQLYERFPVKQHFADLAELLTEATPDVVHITTPPESHFDLATLCLEFGCHVYVEKPLTLHLDEAEHLIWLARDRRLKLTVGHDDQFSHVARRMRKFIQDGYLGGSPVHMESCFCYDIDNAAYARALLGDKDHWVRRLPGKLLHNIISHGIARISEYLTTDDPHVIAHGYVSPVLKSIGETDIVDELRVVICERERTSAYFTFSSQMRPSMHSFSIYGPRNGLMLDQDHERLIKLHGGRYKSYVEKFVPPLLFARQDLRNFTANVKAFLANDFHAKAGMKYLIEAFYRSIADGTHEPIPYREILLTSRIMDRIFEQLRASHKETAVGMSGQASALANRSAGV